MKKNSLIFCLCLVLMSACSSSRQSMERVTQSSNDSLHIEQAEEVSVKTYGRDSLSHNVFTGKTAMSSSAASARQEEIITECVKEYTDSIGQQIRVTDRVIHRVGNYQQHTGSETHSSTTDARTQTQSTLEDSMVRQMNQATLNHRQANDSIAVDKQRNTPETRFGGMRLTSILLLAASLFVVVVCFVLAVEKKIKK